jgi:RecB family exonuclease
LTCKRQYYYRYIQKIKSKKEKELNEGAFLHTLLDHLFEKQNYFMTHEEAEKEINGLLETLLPTQNVKHAYQKLLWREKLKGFIEAQIDHFSQGWRVKEREVDLFSHIGGLRFQGRVDRIDHREDEILVVDYKSGSTQEAQKSKNLETLTDFQMSIYYHLLIDRYSEIKLAFVKILEEGKMEEITALEEKNRLLEEHIIALKQTQSFVAAKCDNVQNCTYCPFILLCERGEYL